MKTLFARALLPLLIVAFQVGCTEKPYPPALVQLPDGYIPRADFNWGDAGREEWPMLCMTTPNPEFGSCNCLRNPDCPLNGKVPHPPAYWCENNNKYTGGKQGGRCTQDCCVECGVEGKEGAIGMKRCECLNGVYSTCYCLPPTWWRPDLKGGTCVPPASWPTPQRPLPASNLTSTSAKGMSCIEEWRVCFTEGDNTPLSERGCVCLRDPEDGLLKLFCGSVNKWFRNNGVAWKFNGENVIRQEDAGEAEGQH